MDLLMRRRQMMIPRGGGGGGDLPAGAIPCDMIYTDGYGGFIESGITPGTSMSYIIDACWVRAASDSQILGYMINQKRYSACRFTNGTFQAAYDGWYNDGSGRYDLPRVAKLLFKTVVTQTHTYLEIYDGSTLIYSVDVTYNETDYTPNQTMAIMGRKNGSTSIDEGSYRGGLSRMKIYTDDHFGTLLADYVPCYYQNNFGLWDTVSQSFLTGYDTTKIYGLGAAWNTEGFTPNSMLNGGSLIDYRAYITTDYIDIPDGCTSIRFNAGALSSGGHSIEYYNASNNYLGYNSYNSTDRVVTPPSGAAKCRMSMSRDNQTTCYIYDVTHGIYLWKGLNVQ